jgi:preprotein translocase subunit YajC
MDSLRIIAQADTNQGSSRVSSQPTQGQNTGTIQDANSNQPATGANKSPSPWNGQLLFFVLLMAVLFLFMIRGPRKQQKEQRQMIQSLKKNDRVRTIGGILGTVIEVKGDEVC